MKKIKENGTQMEEQQWMHPLPLLQQDVSVQPLLTCLKFNSSQHFSNVIYIEREMVHVFIARLGAATHGYLGHVCDPAENKMHDEIYLMHVSFHTQKKKK